MNRFELKTKARLKLVKATPRKEHHGDDLVQAISLRLRMECSNEMLAQLHPNLRDVLFYRAPTTDAQADVPGVEQILPNLRVPIVKEPLKLELSWTGYTLLFDYGLGEESDFDLTGCTLDKFTADGREGGTAIIEWTVSTNEQVTPEIVGIVCGKEGEEIEVTMTGPEIVVDRPVIDASKDGDAPKVCKAENGEGWPFGTDEQPAEPEKSAADIVAEQMAAEAVAGDKPKSRRKGNGAAGARA
jgi:hypothetical protein